LKDKVKVLSDECRRLCDTYPESSSHVKDKENDVLSAWEKLLERSKARKEKLVEAEQLQRFLNNFRDLR
jgi:spectrin beta